MAFDFKKEYKEFYAPKSKPASVALTDELIEREGFEDDSPDACLHHEIYLSDARRVVPKKRKTVIRHPICKKTE